MMTNRPDFPCQPTRTLSQACDFALTDQGAEAQGLFMTILDTGGSTGTFGTP